MDKKIVVRVILYSLVTVALTFYAAQSGKMYGCKLAVTSILQQINPGLVIQMEMNGDLGSATTGECKGILENK